MEREGVGMEGDREENEERVEIDRGIENYGEEGEVEYRIE